MIEHLSIVIPLLNEEDSLPKLLQDIHNSMVSSDINYEIILVDDFSDIKVSDVVEESSSLTIIRNDQNLGQSKSLFKGITAARYDYICTLDGDGQNPPHEIIKLLEEFNSNFNEIDAVVGYRLNRSDKFTRKFYSKLANYFIAKITKTDFLDLGCSLKIFRKKDANSLDLTGDIHRVFNILLMKKGLKIKQVGIEHYPRKYGESKYSYTRILPVIVDSILIVLTGGFQKTSRYVLGKISFIFLFTSSLLFLISLYQKYFLDVFVHRNQVFLLGILFLFISIQIFVTIVTIFFIEINKKNNNE